MYPINTVYHKPPQYILPFTSKQWNKIPYTHVRDIQVLAVNAGGGGVLLSDFCRSYFLGPTSIAKVKIRKLLESVKLEMETYLNCL